MNETNTSTRRRGLVVIDGSACGEAPTAALDDPLPSPSALARRAMRVVLWATHAELGSAGDAAATARRRADTLCLLRQAVADARVPPVRLTDHQVARLLIGLTDHWIRDRTLEWSCGERGEAALRVWTELAGRAVSPYDRTPLTLTAWAAWIHGQHGLARAAADRAIQSSPDCRLAWLILQALRQGSRPERVRPAADRGRPPRASDAPVGRSRPLSRPPGRPDRPRPVGARPRAPLPKRTRLTCPRART